MRKVSVVKKQAMEYTIISGSEKSTPKLFKLLSSILRDLFLSRELAWRLFIRDISAQYRQSLLGVFWAFFPPIITSVIFILLQSRNIISTSTINLPYPAYVLIGTTLWQIFADSVNAPLKATINAKPYIVKIFFPREALIFSAFLSVMFNVVIRMIIIIGVLIFYKIQIQWGILLAPFGIFVLVLLGIVIGILITPIGMLYSDVSTSLPIVLQLLFFATPVVYSLPEKFPFSLISIINPVSPILIATRNIITVGYIDNLLHVTIVLILTIVVFFFSLLLYRISLPILIEKLGT